MVLISIYYNNKLKYLVLKGLNNIMEGPQSQKKKILLFFTWHGERSDKIMGSSLIKNMISNDPTITDSGKNNASHLGTKIRDFIQSQKPDYTQLIQNTSEIFKNE